MSLIRAERRDSSTVDTAGLRGPRRFALLLVAFAGLILVAGCGGGGGGEQITDTPTFSPAGGTYTSSQTVTVGDTTPGATLYCTTDGSTPSSSSPPCPEPITVATSEKVSAIAIAPGYSSSSVGAADYQITLPPAPAPTFSPAAGTYNAAQSVTIGDPIRGAFIYYTVDGSAPTTSSALYTSPIAVSASETIHAIAVAPGYSSSTAASAGYVIHLPPPAPAIATMGNSTTTTYPSTISVVITDADASASIYYTTDGTSPSTTNGAQYTSPLIVSSTETIAAIAFDSKYINTTSFTSSQLMTVTEATPTFRPGGGVISTGTQVVIQDADPGATIFYTTDGSQAAPGSTKYTGAISVRSALTINAIALDTSNGADYTESAQASASYTPFSGGTISGTASSGTMPIIGATVHLYAAGTTGYGTGAKSLTTVPATVTTDVNGAYSLGYTCPAAPGDQIYLVATGGSTTGSGSESGIALMAALGKCANLPQNNTVILNELSTVASAYSLSGFAAASASGGVTVGAPAPNATCTTAGISIMGKATCNYIGLGNAFRTPYNLVDFSTGTALSVTEFYGGSDPNNLNGWSSTYGDPSSTCPGATCLSSNNAVPAPALNTSTAPYQRVNTLGNVLASCVEKSGNCTALFALAGNSSDTLQAALYIAQHPGAYSGTAGLYGLIANPSAPFTPPYGAAGATLNAEPNDWTLAIGFTGAGLGIDPQVDATDYLTNQVLAVDAIGDVWTTASALNNYPAGINVTGNTVGTVAGFDTLGEALTPPTSLVNDLVAYDGSTEYSSYGGFGPDVSSSHLVTNKVGIFGQPSSFLIDASQNLWLSNNFGQYDPGGSEVTIANNPALGAHNLALNSDGPSYALPDEGISLVADNTGNLWQTAGVLNLFEYDSSGNLLNLVSITLGPTTSPNVNGLCNATFDVNGTLWVDDCGTAGNGGQIFALAPTSGQLVATFNGAATQLTASGTLAAGSGGDIYACNSAQTGYLVFNTSNVTGPVGTFNPPNKRCGTFLTVDGAGHIWSYGGVQNGEVLDEVDGAGHQLTPNSGLTATSADELSTVGLNIFNGTAGGGQGGMAVDQSGNLWFLNGTAGTISPAIPPANALVEFVGVAAPTVNPAAIATQNGAEGTMP